MNAVSEASIAARDLDAELTALEDRFGADIETVLARSEQIELAAGALADEAVQVRARLLQANMHRRAGDVARAARMCWEANSWADERAHRPLLARSHQMLSAVYDNLGDTATGLEHALRAVEFLDDDTPPRLRAVMLVKLADDLAMAGSPDAARERYRQAEEIALGLADIAMLVTVLNNLAYAEYLAGDFERAWAAMARLRETTDRAGQRLTPDAMDTLARIEIALGRHADAARTAAANVAEHAAGGGDDNDSMAEFLLTLAVAQRHLGETAAAQDSLDECAALCRERDLAGIGVRVLQEQAELHGARGEFARAFATHKEYHAAEQRLVSRERAAQARTRHAMFETAEARREAERFREQARRDPLTGLHNRRYVDEQLPALLSRTPAVVAIADLDHFKRINDQCSHQIGDRVLVAVAELLHAATAAPGFAARLGGEEFLIVLAGPDDADLATRLEELRRAVAEHDWAPLTGDLPVTVSLGVASAALGSDPSPVLARADRALYAAKHGGRNRVSLASH
ncbi:diguanylate cyclase [Actinoplanes sp. NPDC049668]|uniref:tetratricopeptide repeat-containing diguanylate cyclase n=1 Tax=Actinoplanes sp. NPDC049668 TaxID=3363904 RepID=UPI0037941DA1